MGDRIQALIREHRPQVVVLDLSRVFDIEYSALQMLIQGERRAAEAGITLWLADLSPSVLNYVRASGFAAQLGPERLFFNVRAVIRHYQTNDASLKSADDPRCDLGGHSRGADRCRAYRRVCPAVAGHHQAEPGQAIPFLAHHSLFIGLSWMLALIHGAAIGIWALFYQWQGILPDAESALYFSGVTYLTIGYGDLVLPSPWRMLAPVEGLMGMLMGGLSASLFFAIAARIHQSRHDETLVHATRYKTSSSRD